MLKENDLVDLGIPQMKRLHLLFVTSSALVVRNSVLKEKKTANRSFMIVAITLTGMLLYYSSFDQSPFGVL